MSAPSAPSVADLLDDLDAERAALTDVVRELPGEDWGRPTRAVPWSVRDQIAHLGFFDAAFAKAIATPDAFVAERDAITDLAGFVDDANATVPEYGPAALAWWRDAADAFDAAARELDATDPKARLPWYGPPMSLRSAITSRIMETWAHGADIADALGLTPSRTDRLRHVADIGVRARAQGYRARGLAVPEEPVLVELAAPSGAVWTWGDDSGVRPQTSGVRSGTPINAVRGDAEEFCLVLVRRRHVDDTSLEVTGDAAREWMEVGQMFAGPPGADPVRLPR
jgi:uncharacterized protein (TIGR03084 family)